MNMIKKHTFVLQLLCQLRNLNKSQFHMDREQIDFYYVGMDLHCQRIFTVRLILE